MQDDFCFQQLKSCDLFRELNEIELSSLYALMVKVHLKAGEVLVTQGEISNSMFVLLSGRLRVKTSDGKIVGQISRGQTVGEMGLITHETRSASVTAMRESLLLKLDNDHFNQVWKKHPDVLFQVTKMITRRFQKTLKSGQNYNRDSNIVIVSGHREVNMALFIEQLFAAFDKNFRYKILRHSDFSADLSITDLHEAVETLENQYDYLFYEVGHHREWREFCLERADRIIVVVNSNAPPVIDTNVLEGLKTGNEHSGIKTILVLLHDVWTSASTTANWLGQFHFVQHHHICIHQKDHFARLLRFINGSAIGLVLGGGGTRAWAQMGVIQFLFEQNIPIDACAGTSAGAMNAAGLAISRDYQDYQEASYTIARLLKFNEYTIPLTSLLSSTSLTRALKEIFGETKIEDLKTMLFCVAADLMNSTEVDIHQGLLWRAVRASAAIPGIYPPVYDDGKLLVDGAVVNNLPVDVLRNYFDGLGKIIAVDIAEKDRTIVEYNYPLELNWRWMLRHKLFSRASEFRLPSLAGTVLKAMMLSSLQKTHLNVKMSDVYIKPALSHFGFLNNSDKDKLIEIGYAAAKESLQDNRQLFFVGESDVKK